ncbi:MAG: hypothetical protein K1Y02_10390 [Candidatus Hydrogenedentes bacterium]|nr:hypothetical protein [Candidatus Hydrogenedentota bacterium]
MRYRVAAFGPLIFAVGLIAGVAISSVWHARDSHASLPVTDAPPGLPSPSVAANPPAGLPTAQSSSGNSAPSTGFQMRFVQGDISNYRVDAAIRGKGFDAGEFSGVETQFVSDFSVLTKEVAADKSADMRISFDSAQLTGSFMDVPFEMGYTPERSYMFYGNTSYDTAKTPAQPGNSQFAYFSTPIAVRVASNGSVQKIEGPEGMASMLSAVPSLSFVEYPADTIEQGKAWESRFALPIPGFGGAVQARVTNTFLGYQELEGHTCGVIQQTYATDDTVGDAPLVNTEEGVSIGMPTFDLNGQGLVYFDVNNGKLVHSTLNLQLTMGLSKMLGGLADVLSTITQDYANQGEAESEQPANLLDLMLTIEGAITLIDPSASAAPR